MTSRLYPLVCLLLLGGCIAHPGMVHPVKFASDARTVVATTRTGAVRGIEGAGVRAFLGLPYAAPPIGDQRWRAPQPAEPWTGIRDATRIGSDCVQALGRRAVLGGGGGIVVGSEDCLSVNVYAPAGEVEQPRPVMVYLHGGAFTIGAGGNYDPSRLAKEQDRVVVTVNFRLGALGWLVHPDFEGAGGNFGLRDQQAALRWVQANIATFGGDPADVTLFSESSGAWSACHLMAAPSSQGLYSRVILQSGPCLEPSSLNAQADQVGPGEVFAERLGCAGEGVVDCLRRFPAWKIARAASQQSGINGPGSWGPVYGDALVPLSPAEAFATGRFVRTPVIVGSNADEGRLFAVEVRDADRYADETRWLYGDAGEGALAHYPVSDADGKSRWAIAIAQSFTDSRFACPSDALRRVLSKWVPTYGYEFADQNAPFRLPAWITGLKMGAYHASEATYVFGTSWIFADTGKWTPDQRVLSDRMMRLWAGFGHDPAFDAAWPKVNDGGGPVLRFDPAGDRVDPDFFDAHQCSFWGGTALGAPV
ncbi:carboxylesterase/lipase family protein [soil metagenome]